MWQSSSTAIKQRSLKLDNQKGAPTVKDLIIANMVNSLIVYHVYYMCRCALRESLTTDFATILHIFLLLNNSLTKATHLKSSAQCPQYLCVYFFSREINPLNHL